MSGRHRAWCASPAGDASHAHRGRNDLVASRETYGTRWTWRVFFGRSVRGSVYSDGTYATRHGAQRGCERWLRRATRDGGR